MNEEPEVYTLPELKELSFHVYERALDKLREWELQDLSIDDWGVESLFGFDECEQSQADSLMAIAMLADPTQRFLFPHQFVADYRIRELDTYHGVCRLKDLEFTMAGLLVGGLPIHLLKYVTPSGRFDDGWYEEEHPDENVDLVVAQVEEIINELTSDMEHRVVKIVRDEEDYRTSEEYLLEMAEANEWVFDEEGKIV